MPLLSLLDRLPSLQPERPGPRLLLFALRQMGRHGVDDACAAHAYMTGFGVSFRRPLVLTRTLVVELAEASSQPIEIAPWCCPRVTSAESALLTALTRCEAEPRAAEKLLADMLGTRDAQGVLAVVQTLAFTFRDLGLPIAVVV